MDRPKETIGARVARFRQAQGWTQEDLAFEAGVTQSTISLIEIGSQNMRSETLYALADALGVSADDIWLGEEDSGDEAAQDEPHANCPPILGCRDGRIPEGWVRADALEGVAS